MAAKFMKSFLLLIVLAALTSECLVLGNVCKYSIPDFPCDPKDAGACVQPCIQSTKPREYVWSFCGEGPPTYCNCAYNC
ncbi:hypothetical protein ACP275_06G067600 [Erythranthe tilingii]